MKRIVVALIAVLSFQSSGVAAASFAPRPISDAERHAVSFALDYLRRGPVAFREVLASDSPLASLDPDAQIKEIEVRAGPPAGATWKLQTVTPSLAPFTAVFSIEFPSGVDDTLVMGIEFENGVAKIRDLHVSGEPSPWASVVVPRKPVVASSDAPTVPSSLPLVAVLAAALVAAFAALGRRRRMLSAMLLVVSLAVTGLALWRHVTEVEAIRAARVKPDEPERPGWTRLGRLLDLRRAAAAGDRAPAVAITRGTAAETAALWRAQLALLEHDDEEVSRLVSSTHDERIPLRHLLRARLAMQKSNEVEAGLEYEKAIELGPGQDGLWQEAAEAFWFSGFRERAKEHLDRLARIGSRDATVVYLAASVDRAGDSREQKEASEAFLAAWKMMPVPRASLLTKPGFWGLLDEKDVRAKIDLSSVDEPLVATPPSERGTLKLAADETGRVCGDLLEVSVGDATLVVPGGGSLASASVPRVDAVTRERDEEARAIEGMARTLDLARSAGSMAQPTVRRRVVSVAMALAKENRWNDVARLTEGFSASDEHVPTNVLLLEALSLRKTGRAADSLTLLEKMFVSKALRRRAGTEFYLQLGELLATAGQYALARRALDVAASRKDLPWIDDRARQLSLDERLSTSTGYYGTEHFKIRYTDDSDRSRAVRVGGILESELKREQKWIPVRNFRPTEVHILSWQEFRRIYTGGDQILAFYDGRIRYPIANARLMPQVIAIISHELAHAMIAQNTNDMAPHWFHEGLAQNVELSKYRPNIFATHSDEQLLALPVIEAVLNGYPDYELTSTAYLESLAFVRFIEQRKGLKGIHEMLDRFREGDSTDEALRSVFGKDPREVERDFRKWGRTEAPAIWISKVDDRYRIDRNDVERQERALRDRHDGGKGNHR